MSILENTIRLLKKMPNDKIETVYAFVQLIDSDIHDIPSGFKDTKMEAIKSMLGIVHEYANLELIEQEDGAFEHAIAEKYEADRY